MQSADNVNKKQGTKITLEFPKYHPLEKYVVLWSGKNGIDAVLWINLLECVRWSYRLYLVHIY